MSRRSCCARSLFHAALAALCLVAPTAAPGAGEPTPSDSVPPAAPAASPPPAPSLYERARALLNHPDEAGEQAAAWVRRHLDADKARALLAELRTDAKGTLDEAVAQARERHTKEMGVRIFNGKSLSLGNQAWTPLAADPANASPEEKALAPHAVVLIHGLHEPGDIWNDLVPYLAAADMKVARFDYPNDGPIRDGAARLIGWLRQLKSRGVTSVDLVCHSMGGLVARDALTRPGLYAGRADAHHPDLPTIKRCILIGTPNKGSPWAHVEVLAEWRDQFQRFLDSEADADLGHLAGWFVDGRGEAGDDLLPDSGFLNELNARPAPIGVEFTSIVGKAVSPEALGMEELLSSKVVTALLSSDEIAELRASIQQASETLGDGPVSTESAELPHGRTVRIDAAHNSMLRRLTLPNMARNAIDPKHADEVPAAIPAVLEALKRP
ncbi:MAG: esterase/lipase family protein [Phycisphaerales bacterium]